ncbi:MAG: hypothetical protein KF723_20665 [Rhizobiaceae bacterium]|nr:hypothetical protein [Rhizobiaceae bacterium]
MRARAQKPKTYDRRRRDRTLAIRLGLSIAIGVVLLLLAQNFEWLWQASRLREIVGPFDFRKSLVSWLERIWLVGDFIKNNPAVVARVGGGTLAFFAGAATAWLSLKSVSARLHERYFQAFDDRVLTAIGPAQPYDPLRGAAGTDAAKDVPLPFVLPSSGGRRAVWADLERLTGDGRTPRKAFEGPETAFGWSLLMGRSGSGKSRMAMEFARHLSLAATPPLPIGPRLASWWRVQALGKRCGDADAWEAGWLRPGSRNLGGGTYSEWVGRMGAGNSWLAQLAAWRPRRPTILILDDPHLEDTRKIVDTLHTSSGHFRHEVRLIVVNQTAPSEMRLAYQADEWRSFGSLNPHVPPITMPDEGRFDEADVRALRGHGVLPGKTFPLARDEHVRRFVQLTEGNPLLVEIALRRLRDGAELADLSRESLVAERVDRVLEALEQAGLGDLDHRQAIAAATLADGVGSRETITETYPLPTRQVEELKRVFPADALDLRTLLPAIKPDAIGDAFVRRVFSDLGPKARDALIATAWRASVRGTLRSALRLLRHDDDLGRALSLPPAGSGLDPVEVALAYAEAAFRFKVETGPEPIVDNPPATLLKAAVDLLAALEPTAAFTALERLVDLAAPRADGTAVRATYWESVLAAAMGSVGNEGTAPPRNTERLHQLVSAIWDRWQHLRGAGWNDPTTELLRGAVRRMVAALGLAESDRLDLLVHSGNVYARQRSYTLAGALAVVGDDFAPHARENADGIPDAATVSALVALAQLAARFSPDVTRGLADVFSVWTAKSDDRNVHRANAALAVSAAFSWLDRDTEQVIRLAELVDGAANSWPEDRDMQFERAQVWRFVAFAKQDAPTCRSHAETIDRIAAPWADDRDMQLERALAWRSVAFATNEDMAAHRSDAETVDRIAAPWPLNRNMQFARAQAWRSVAFSAKEDVAVCHHYAETVDRIAAPWPNDRDIQVERAVAWRSVAFAAKKDMAACRLHAETVERIATPWPDDRNMQLERATAWRFVAFAASEDAVASRSHAETVDRIAAPWPNDRDMQLERAIAWRFGAFEAQGDLATCRSHAETVDRITAPWPNDRDMQFERAQAWRSVAIAAIEDAAGCQSYAENVDRIAAPWPNDRDMQFERAQAWRAAIFATKENAAVCHSLAETTDRLVAQWPDDHELQRERAHAWRLVVFATKEDPRACRSHAETVDRISAPWPEDLTMQYERAHAWRIVAYANRRDQDTSREHADTVAKIVARWPNNAEMQRELDLARGYAGLSSEASSFQLSDGQGGSISVTFGTPPVGRFPGDTG